MIQLTKEFCLSDVAQNINYQAAALFEAKTLTLLSIIP
ncbi:hypothetical protein ABAC402_01635 [Asticcacaulis sp. AC402]|nr:hypothetical protein ABAC402_01635 [Asticcacaulis sp. AC402]